jgi:hypothetical protein
VAKSSGDESNDTLVNALLKMGAGDDYVISCDEDLPESLGGNEKYPIYLTMLPTELSAFLSNLKESYISRQDDFVFFSGGLEYGNIEDILKDQGKISQ